ncbi:recombinase family protein [Sedimentimonas flavescens]|uniref:recombinase family protein n=1 Tax=Sedimentimonas flavescens TaxID=2851012 RepID=UPI0021A47467|nr:recombinase family protein [Sedimentimonas flavescens]MCT2539976.1 recombinase family protein [Sedimentimonas flavescens]
MSGSGKAVGFYWTLPVPWVGFTQLPKDVDDAANSSLTIRYQRDLIRRYAKDHRLVLVHEAAYLEIEPDRGSEHVRDALRKVGQVCHAHHAVLLIVDFSEVQGWRSHHSLLDWARSGGVDVRLIYPDPITMEGKSFDPHQHFSDWRQRQQEWSDGKAGRAEASRAEATRLRGAGLSFVAISKHLNANGLPSLTGKPWTPDNLRKLLSKEADGE